MRAALLASVAAAAAVAATPAGAADLVLKQVMLSSAGIGYFQFDADVDGAATLGLDVPLDQVDDVLKSIVVFDDAGAVGGVELPARDDTHSAFGGVPFGPDALSNPLDLINSLQGVDVTVQGPRPMSGRVLHADIFRDPPTNSDGASGIARERTRVTLLTDDGLRQFVLEEVEAVQVTDPALRGRVAAALASLKRDSGRDARHLTLRVGGQGRRTVHVAYVAAAPLWKASFRVVLPSPLATVDPKARLQGWATLENDTKVDWKNVTLTLQYGNPVTFRQAIYKSYYVSRPEVPVEVLGRILPDVDTRAQSDAVAAFAPPPAPMAAPFASAAQASAAPRGVRPGPMAKIAGSAPSLAVPVDEASAEQGTEETVFTLGTPVTLTAGHSLSVPIADRSFPADRVALAESPRPHPLASLRVRNDSAISLPAGVLALYEANAASAFAGDARLGGLPPGETRLISFAEDLRSSVSWSSRDDTALSTLTASGGVLHLGSRDRHADVATVTAAASEPRRVLVQVPKRGGWALVRDGLPGPVETTDTGIRVAVDLKPGETKTVTIVQEYRRTQDVAIIGNDQVITRVLGEQGLPEMARNALKEIERLRGVEAARRADRDRLVSEKSKLIEDEARVRANLGAVGTGEALHARLVKQLDSAETRIDDLTGKIAAADGAVAAAHDTLAKAVSELSI